MNNDDVIIVSALLFFVLVAATCAGSVLMSGLEEATQGEVADAD